MHTHIQHAWKPLVERGMHIETNKHAHIHTPFMCLFLQRQRTKTKMVERRNKKKFFLTKK